MSWHTHSHMKTNWLSTGPLDRDDDDSDTDSKVSGSLAVDKAWKAIQEKGYRKSSTFLDEEINIDPIGDSHFDTSQDNGPLSGDHWESELMGAKTTTDVKSVTKLMTGSNSAQPTRYSPTHKPPLANGVPSSNSGNMGYGRHGHAHQSSAPGNVNGYGGGTGANSSTSYGGSHRVTPPGSHGKPSPLMQRRVDGMISRQKTPDHSKQQSFPVAMGGAGGGYTGHQRTVSNPNQPPVSMATTSSHFSPRMQHRQFQPTSQQQQVGHPRRPSVPIAGIQRPTDAYHSSIQIPASGNATAAAHMNPPGSHDYQYHSASSAAGTNWGRVDPGGTRMMEVTSPDRMSMGDRNRHASMGMSMPTAMGQSYNQQYRRRSDDPVTSPPHFRGISYQTQSTHHAQQGPLSPMSHSKSTEFPPSSVIDGNFDGRQSTSSGLPPGGMPTGRGYLPRSNSTGYGWREGELALDMDAHHMKSSERIPGTSSELPYRNYDGQVPKSPYLDRGRRSGSIPRSEGSSSVTQQREPEIGDVIEFLSSDNPNVVANAASYLQHLAYGDDAMKSRIREFGAIPVLINQLNYPDIKVQLAVLGALRNLSFGRLNDDNKIAIATDHGLPQLLHLLRVSRSPQVRELVTGILWNLSSCEELKLRIIKNSLNDIVTFVLIPYSGWSEALARDPSTRPNQIHWNTELRNSTGTLRNVSSAGEPARVFMRSCTGLVDALLWTIKTAVSRKDDIDNKTIENAVCILRNLSYRLENEIDPQEGAEDVLDNEWEKEQRRELEEDKRVLHRSRKTQRRSWLTLCVRPAAPNTEEVSYNPSQFVRRDAAMPMRRRPVFGIALLWQPDVVHPYLELIKASSNPDTLEAACGAIHNLTACSWKWAGYVRNVVRNSKGLPNIIALIEANHDPVIRAATTALRNLAIDPRNKAIIGDQAMESLVTRLPHGPRHIGLSDSTTTAILCALIELTTESPENSRLFRLHKGVSLAVKLARSKQHIPKIVFAANKLCSVLYDFKDTHAALKREGWDLTQYSRIAKETGHCYEFEPRSISKDFRSSTRSKSNKKKREKEHSKSTGALNERSRDDTLPSPVPSTATTNLGMERQSSPALDFDPKYEMVDQKKQTSQSVPNLGAMGTYSVIPDSSLSPKDHSTEQQPTGSEPGRFDPNAVYAQVDKNKKRSTRRHGQEDHGFGAVQSPVEPVGGDSWV